MEIVLKGLKELVARESSAMGETREIPLLTAAEAKTRLRLSLRQVYRLMAQNRLKPVGKFLGQWVFKRKDIELFHPARRGRGARLPDFLRPVFWSYRLEDVDPCAHAGFVVGQILEHGGWDAVRWANGYYGLRYIFLAAKNHRELSPPARNFWRLLEKHAPS